MASLDIRFDHYMPYDELMAAAARIADAYPSLVTSEKIGESYEGRPVMAFTVTNSATGPASDKPAFICDGNIHATEVSASAACLYLLHSLAVGCGQDEWVTRALDTRAFYIVPRVNPDGAEQYFADPPRFLRSSVRRYPFDEEDFDGLETSDIDGDGRILSMRIKDPNGPWKVSDRDPRLVVAREPEEVGGTYYRLMPEGLIHDYDGWKLKIKRRKERLDMNRNFAAHWRPDSGQPGAGPFPGSEPEVRNLMKFVTDHTNICGGITFHTFSGVLLRPSTTLADSDLPAEDVWTYDKIGEKGSQITGYPNVSVFHDFRYHPNEVITGVYDDWMYEHRGVFAWTVEIWSPQRKAGITEGFAPGGKKGTYRFTSWHRDHPIDEDVQMLKWSDEVLEGKAFVDWTPFSHPQLGAVEIGGWDVQYAFRNPPPHLLEEEIAPLTRWAIWHCLISPKLELLHCEAESLGGTAHKIKAVVQNAGWLPTYVTKQALKAKSVRGVVAVLDLGEGVSIRSGERRVVGPQLEGRAYETASPFGWTADETTDRAFFEWTVDAAPGSECTITICHERAGKVSTILRF